MKNYFVSPSVFVPAGDNYYKLIL